MGKKAIEISQTTTSTSTPMIPEPPAVVAARVAEIGAAHDEMEDTIKRTGASLLVLAPTIPEPDSAVAARAADIGAAYDEMESCSITKQSLEGGSSLLYCQHQNLYQSLQWSSLQR